MHFNEFVFFGFLLYIYVTGKDVLKGEVGREVFTPKRFSQSENRHVIDISAN